MDETLQCLECDAPPPPSGDRCNQCNECYFISLLRYPKPQFKISPDILERNRNSSPTEVSMLLSQERALHFVT